MTRSDYIRLENETTWPDPTALGELAWKLCWAPHTITKEEALLAASVVNAYNSLMTHPSRDLRARTHVRMRRALKNAGPRTG